MRLRNSARKARDGWWTASSSKARASRWNFLSVKIRARRRVTPSFARATRPLSTNISLASLPRRRNNLTHWPAILTTVQAKPCLPAAPNLPPVRRQIGTGFGRWKQSNGISSHRRIARKLGIRQPRAAILRLVGPNGNRRGKHRCTARRYQVVLIHAVTAHTNRADEHAVAVERKSAGENGDAVRQVRVHIRRGCEDRAVHRIGRQNGSAGCDDGKTFL